MLSPWIPYGFRKPTSIQVSPSLSDSFTNARGKKTDGKRIHNTFMVEFHVLWCDRKTAGWRKVDSKILNKKHLVDNNCLVQVVQKMTCHQKTALFFETTNPEQNVVEGKLLAGGFPAKKHGFAFGTASNRKITVNLTGGQDGQRTCGEVATSLQAWKELGLDATSPQRDNPIFASRT